MSTEENNENINDNDNNEVVEETNDNVEEVNDSTDSSNDEEVKDWKAEAEKWRSNSRKNETASKENYKKLNELTSEFEALKGQLAEASKFKDENFNLMKRLVIAETGLPAELGNRLNGSNEEELKQDAESLKELFGVVKKTPKPVRTQGTDLPSGNSKPVFKSQEEYTQYYKNK